MRILISLLLFAGLFCTTPAEAQIWKKIRKSAEQAAERTVQRETQEQTEKAVRGAIDGAEDAAVEGSTDEGAAGNVGASADVDAPGSPAAPATGTPQAAVGEGDAAEAGSIKPGEGAWANYDFVPGERVLFFDDYSRDNVGDFPRRFEFLKGNWEIVEWQGQRLFRNTGPRHAAFKIVLPEALPERFTIEFDAYFPHTNQRMAILTAEPEGGWHSVKHNFFRVASRHGTGVDVNGNGGESLNADERIGEALTPVRIMVDGRYAKVYVDEHRVANMPNADLPRTNTLYFVNTYFADDEYPMYLSAIRVAAGGRALYDALATEGRFATQGIFFDTGSARLRPESTPTLKEIGRTLQEHPGLRLRIEGHTDDTGSDAVNQPLSQQRAEAVRRFLVETYGVDAGRLEAQGFGTSNPLAPNDTPEGRQTNRRVELVRLD